MRKHSNKVSLFSILLFYSGFISPFSILVSLFSIFFSHIPFAARARFSSLRIRFLRNYVLLFARAPHVTHLRPRGARSRVRSGCRTRDGAVAALPSASQLARRTRERDRRETRARARDPSPVPTGGSRMTESDVRGPCARAGPTSCTTEHVCHPQSPHRHRTATNARCIADSGLGAGRHPGPRSLCPLASAIQRASGSAAWA